MKTKCTIPVLHTIRQMRYYDFYLSCTGSSCQTAEVSAYLNCRSQESESEKNVSLILISGTEGSLLRLPFTGFLRFEIPESARNAESSELTLVLEPENEEGLVTCEIQTILLNNDYACPWMLPLECLRFCANRAEPSFGSTLPLFPITSAALVKMKISETQKTACFELPDVKPNEYVLLYKSLGEAELYDDTACRMFIAKNNYCPGEPVVLSYQNIYLKMSAYTAMVDILMYLDGDRPGIDRSRDFVTLMFQDYCRGFSGNISFPVDGSRVYYPFLPGHYTIRLMQAYQDLCQMLEFTASDAHRENELKSPPDGTLFYIRASQLPERLEIRTKHPERLTVLRFTCDSPLADLFAQHVYRMNDVTSYFELLRKESSPRYLLYALLLQILNTAYTYKVGEIAQSAGNEVNASTCDKIAAYINHNLYNKITMKMLANEFHISESHLSHSFKRYKNISISKYIYNAKIARAKEWLSEDRMTVTEIAEHLNYSDIYAFSHAFKLLVGMSPLEYKKNVERAKKIKLSE